MKNIESSGVARALDLNITQYEKFANVISETSLFVSNKRSRQAAIRAATYQFKKMSILDIDALHFDLITERGYIYNSTLTSYQCDKLNACEYFSSLSRIELRESYVEACDLLSDPMKFLGYSC